MRFKYALWLLFTGTCIHGPGQDSSKPTVPGIAILYTISADHIFSTPEKKDHFQLSVNGKSFADGKISFMISTSNHKQIHTASFPTYDLLYNYDASEFGRGTELSLQKKENIIRSRMKRFFSETCFRYPAIKPSEQYDKGDNIAQSVWDDIHTDKTAIGFVYSLGYERRYGIAFSKKKKKTVLYFYSD